MKEAGHRANSTKTWASDANTLRNENVCGGGGGGGGGGWGVRTPRLRNENDLGKGSASPKTSFFVEIRLRQQVFTARKK